MGSRVCGLCRHYKVWAFKDDLGNKWDICALSRKKVTSLQGGCKDYQVQEPINLPEWFIGMVKKYPERVTKLSKRTGRQQLTTESSRAIDRWWKKYFVKKEEAEKKAKEAREGSGLTEGPKDT